MNRREFLQCAAVMAAGASALQSTLVLSQEQQAFLAAQPNYIDRAPVDFFSAEQRSAVTSVAEQIIPATETPGAIDAGVPRFVELMVKDWFNDAERDLFMQGLVDLQQRSGGDFASLPNDHQLALLQQLEEESADSDWYDLGNILRIWDDSAPFICQFKELVVLGFMLSEVGGTKFQRENPMGSFDGALPLANDDAAYAAEMPIRLMAAETSL
jgi:gluconate 2-dehydrogenase gamma chain